MNAQTRRVKAGRKANIQSKAALARYLAAGLGAAGLATVESEAAIVTLNLTSLGSNSVNVTGTNAGITFGNIDNLQGLKNVPNFPFTGFGLGNQFRLFNGFSGSGISQYSYIGFISAFPSVISFATGNAIVTPTKFGNSASIDSSSSWKDATNNANNSLFAFGPTASPTVAPNWGANSYLGFRLSPSLGTFNYGYFEVTWNNTSKEFQILSGAYESTVNTPIITPVPEPSAVALAGIGALALGAGAIRRSRLARKAAAEGAVAEAI